MVETNGHRGPVDPAELSVRLAHASPGRVRLRVERSAPDTSALAVVERSLSERSEVYALTANPATRSLLICFDPQTLEFPEVLVAIEASGVRLERPSEEPASEPLTDQIALGLTVDSLANRLDRGVADRTSGGADLRTLVPLGFGALAVRELVAGRFVAVPWYAFAWYAFDSYWKLRRPDRDEDGGQD